MDENGIKAVSVSSAMAFDGIPSVDQHILVDKTFTAFITLKDMKTGETYIFQMGYFRNPLLT